MRFAGAKCCEGVNVTKPYVSAQLPNVDDGAPSEVDLLLLFMTHVNSKMYRGPLHVCNSEMVVDCVPIVKFDLTKNRLLSIQKMELHVDE